MLSASSSRHRAASRSPSLRALSVTALLVALTPEQAAASDHYWVYFADKGGDASSRGDALEQRRTTLSARALARRQRVRGEQVIDERDLPVVAAYVDAVEQLGAKLRTRSRWLNAISIEADPVLLDAVALLPHVREVRPVARARRDPRERPGPERLESTTTTVDRGERSEWDYGFAAAQLEAMNVPAAHRCGLTGKGVVIGVLDSGFNVDHPAFANLDIVDQRDFINGDDNVGNESGDPSDAHSHGTSVLSLIAGNEPGEYVSVAPGVSIYLAKTEDVGQEEPIEEDWYVEAMEWLEQEGVDITTSSLGYTDWYDADDYDGDTAPTSIAVDIATENGVITLTAAGNGGPTAPSLGVPADAHEVLTLGATEISGKLASFSSRGPTADGRIKPDLCAPGANVAVARATGGYGKGSGTSFSTPLAAGAVALLVEMDPELTPDDVEELLKGTAVLTGDPDNDYGWGSIDMLAATQAYCECDDGDGDGHDDAVCGGDDCDDGDAKVHPEATEVCDDDQDNDCDGDIDARDDDCEGAADEDDDDDDDDDDATSDDDDDDDPSQQPTKEGCVCASSSTPRGRGSAIGWIFAGLAAFRRRRRR